ncbi:MAG: ATP-binding cassette domain-containing protein [Candidatus Thorarchaeota archaeon]
MIANPERSSSVSSAMLIVKSHRRANDGLRRKLLLVIKHPNMAFMNVGLFDFIIKLIVLAISLIVTMFLAIIGLNDTLLLFLSLVVTAYVVNRVIKWYIDKPEGFVSEINTFMVSHLPIKDNKYNNLAERLNFEEKIRKSHRKYKRSLLRKIADTVENDLEYKNSKIVLQKAAKSLGTSYESLIEFDMETWAYQILDRIHKGSRLTYWNNIDGKDRLVVSDSLNQKVIFEIEEQAEDIVDELILLVFGNRYSSLLVPLLQQTTQFSNKYENAMHKLFDSLKTDFKHDEGFAEAYRVLLSKCLGMQEVLKTTVREIERIKEAKNEITKESHLFGSEILETLAEEFVTEEAYKSYLETVDQLRKSLQNISTNLRSLNYDKIPTGDFYDLQYIAGFYLALEKMRFITTWFEDIASFTTVTGGIGFETGVDLKEKTEIPKEVVLKAKNVFKNYHSGGGTIYALRGTSFEINRGEFVAITGASGSGKTTLLNILAGLDKPDRGSVFIDGTNLALLSDSKLSELRRDKIGFVFQYYNLLPVLTNAENVAFPADMGGNTQNLKSRTDDCLRSVELQDFGKQYPNKLSGGQMQRVTIARSLINNPSIIFADEPTGDLDSVTGKQIMDLLAKTNKEKGTTIVLVTHDESLLHYANRTINMQDGKLVEA